MYLNELCGEPAVLEVCLLSNLLCLDLTEDPRLDVDGIQLPPAYLKNFPHLAELHTTSTLPLTKVVIKVRESRIITEKNLVPILHQKLCRLEYLEIMSSAVYDYGSPIIDFKLLPSLKSLHVSQANGDQRQGFFQLDAVPTLCTSETGHHGHYGDALS